MTTSIANTTPTTIDVDAAFAQLNYGDSWRMARLGAHNRAYSADHGYIQFDVKVGRKYRVIVKLAPSDTYSVEIGRMRKPRGSSIREYEVLSQEHDVYCDVLGEVVERMCVEAGGDC